MYRVLHRSGAPVTPPSLRPFLLCFRAQSFGLTEILAVCPAFASARRPRRKTPEKHQKNTYLKKSADQRIFWWICRFFGGRHFSSLLRRFPRACRRSANSEYFERLNNRDPETEGKWRPRNFEIRVVRCDGRAPTPPLAPLITRCSVGTVPLAAARPRPFAAACPVWI